MFSVWTWYNFFQTSESAANRWSTNTLTVTQIVIIFQRPTLETLKLNDIEDRNLLCICLAKPKYLLHSTAPCWIESVEQFEPVSSKTWFSSQYLVVGLLLWTFSKKVVFCLETATLESVFLMAKYYSYLLNKYIYLCDSLGHFWLFSLDVVPACCCV